MAQKTENEEAEFKAVPEKIVLCINNCGLTGNPSTNNMCQKCLTASLSRSSSSSSSSRFVRVPRFLPRNRPVKEESTPPEAIRDVNRCSGCRKRVGLTGFRCRCGDLFCAEHRYSDRHDCSFDYKSAAREVIARENPVVKAPKVARF